MEKLILERIDLNELKKNLDDLDVEYKHIEKAAYKNMCFFIDMRRLQDSNIARLHIDIESGEEAVEKKIQKFQEKVNRMFDNRDALVKSKDFFDNSKDIFGKDRIRIRQNVSDGTKKKVAYRNRWTKQRRTSYVSSNKKVTRIYMRRAEDVMHFCQKMGRAIISVSGPANQSHLDALLDGRKVVFKKTKYYKRFKFRLKIQRDRGFASSAKILAGLLYDNLQEDEWNSSKTSLGYKKPTKTDFIRDYLNDSYWPIIIYLDDPEVYTMIKMTITGGYIIDDHEVITFDEVI